MVLLIAFLALILLLILSITFLKPRPNNPQGNAGVSVPVFSSSPTASILNSQTPTSSATGYTTQGLNQNYQRAITSSLSPQDQLVFSKITASLDGKSNIIASTNSFQIKYVNPPNEFLVEILSTDADAGKLSAISWFSQQGFSPKGVCSLKMVIYLSQIVRGYYQQHGLQFNPVPNGC